MTDYTDLVIDMLNAFGAGPFGWQNDSFSIMRTHDAGSFGWPWEYRHTWRVPAKAPTRDALVRHGWVERIPERLVVPHESWRMSAKALALVEEATYDWRSKTPSHAAWRAAHDAAEADKRANPGRRNIV